MIHYLAHNVNGISNERNVTYIYDMLNRLEHVKDSEIPDMDEMFAYDAQGRIVQQLRSEKTSNVNENKADGVYSYYENTNMLKSVAGDIDGSADKRDMSASENFVYDRDGNLIEDKSKRMTIAYDWRGMPVEFKRQDKCYDIHEQIVCDSIKFEIAYDGAGSRVSKSLFRKIDGTSEWTLEKKIHYTGIGSENRVDGQNGTKVVVNMPQGLGRYGIDNEQADEFYLKNHLGSTMMVAKVSSSNAPAEISAAYDYRAFGEQITLSEPTEKVTENFTGKEKDDETELNYFGARYLDPMLGMWISVDPARQFSSPYLYVGNGMNPISSIDPDGNAALVGAALGVAGGMAFAFAESYRSNQPFHYSLADCITDAAVGALGFGAIKNFGKAASALSNMEKIKTAGKSLRRPRWKNEFNAAKKRT